MDEVLAFAGDCERRLEELDSSSDTSRRLVTELGEQLNHYFALADQLSSKRRKDAMRLEREMRKEFQSLAMEKMNLKVQFQTVPRTGSAGPGRIPAGCGPGGVDQVEFLLAPNIGEEIRPLVRIASGGELSRIMLAIKTLCGGGEQGKTLVFDEIDAGIGGRVAEVIGRRLREAATQSQVLCVTHLPQIAVYAHEHFMVHKEQVEGRTETFLDRLREPERVQELARMMGGEIITETTRRHAREMRELVGKEAKREVRK